MDIHIYTHTLVAARPLDLDAPAQAHRVGRLKGCQRGENLDRIIRRRRINKMLVIVIVVVIVIVIVLDNDNSSNESNNQH